MTILWRHVSMMDIPASEAFWICWQRLENFKTEWLVWLVLLFEYVTLKCWSWCCGTKKQMSRLKTKSLLLKKILNRPDSSNFQRNSLQNNDKISIFCFTLYQKKLLKLKNSPRTGRLFPKSLPHPLFWSQGLQQASVKGSSVRTRAHRLF